MKQVDMTSKTLFNNCHCRIFANPTAGWVEFRGATLGIRFYCDRTASIITEVDGTWSACGDRTYRLPACPSLLENDSILAFTLAIMGDMKAEVADFLMARKTEFIHLFLRASLLTEGPDRVSCLEA